MHAGAGSATFWVGATQQLLAGTWMRRCIFPLATMIWSVNAGRSTLIHWLPPSSMVHRALSLGQLWPCDTYTRVNGAKDNMPECPSGVDVEIWQADGRKEAGRQDDNEDSANHFMLKQAAMKFSPCGRLQSWFQVSIKMLNITKRNGWATIYS